MSIVILLRYIGRHPGILLSNFRSSCSEMHFDTAIYPLSLPGLAARLISYLLLFIIAFNKRCLYNVLVIKLYLIYHDFLYLSSHYTILVKNTF